MAERVAEQDCCLDRSGTGKPNCRVCRYLERGRGSAGHAGGSEKAMRNQGLGFLLTQELIHKAWDAGAEAVTLEVRESNMAAQTVYERCGFISKGVRPDYYEDTHEGAVIMWLYR